MLVATLVLLTLSLIFFGLSVLASLRAVLRMARSKTVSATVVEMTHSSDTEGNTTYRPVFEYLWDGKSYRQGAGMAASPPRYKVGDTATLYINPRNPTDVLPTRFGDVWFMAVLWALLAVVPIGIVIGMKVFF